MARKRIPATIRPTPANAKRFADFAEQQEPRLGRVSVEKLATLAMRVLHENMPGNPAEALPLVSKDLPDPSKVWDADGTRYFSRDAVERELNDCDLMSRSTIVLMSPADFLALAKPGYDESKQLAVNQLVREGTPFADVPKLFAQDNRDGTAQVDGHEGRHRARALQAQGVRQMPVVLRSYTVRWGQTNRLPEPFPAVLISEDGKKRLPMPPSALWPSPWAGGVERLPATRMPKVGYHVTRASRADAIHRDGFKAKGPGTYFWGARHYADWYRELQEADGAEMVTFRVDLDGLPLARDPEAEDMSEWGGQFERGEFGEAYIVPGDVPPDRILGVERLPAAPGYASRKWRSQDWRVVVPGRRKPDVSYDEKCGGPSNRSASGKVRLCLPMPVISALRKDAEGRQILYEQAQRKARAKPGARIPWHPRIRALHRALEAQGEEDDPSKAERLPVGGSGPTVTPAGFPWPSETLLYHTTVAYSTILREGFKTRDQLRAETGIRVEATGGGTAKAVSFAVDKRVNYAIELGLRFLIRAARGEVSLGDLWEQAAEECPAGARNARAALAREGWTDEDTAMFDRGLRRRRMKGIMPPRFADLPPGSKMVQSWADRMQDVPPEKLAEFKQLAAEWWEPIDAREPENDWNREGDDWRRDILAAHYKSILAHGSAAEECYDPLFFGTNMDYLSTLSPEDVGTVAVRLPATRISLEAAEAKQFGYLTRAEAVYSRSFLEEGAASVKMLFEHGIPIREGYYRNPATVGPFPFQKEDEYTPQNIILGMSSMSEVRSYAPDTASIDLEASEDFLPSWLVGRFFYPYFREFEGMERPGDVVRRELGMEEVERLPTAPVTQAPTRDSAFRAWFRESKVVNPDGSPLVVYRGMARVPGEVMQTRHGRATLSFTPDPEVAAVYAHRRSLLTGSPELGPGANVGAYYLSMQNPLDLRDLGEECNLEEFFGAMGIPEDQIPRGEVPGLLEALAHVAERVGADADPLGRLSQRLQEAKKPQEKLLDKALAVYFDTYLLADAPEAVRVAQQYGFDGMILVDVVEGVEPYYQGDDLDPTTYRPFNQTQVKSATGNEGTFDPNDPRVEKLRAYHGSERGDLTEFRDDAKQRRTFGPSEQAVGIFVSLDPDFANAYARGPEGTVYAVEVPDDLKLFWAEDLLAREAKYFPFEYDALNETGRALYDDLEDGKLPGFDDSSETLKSILLQDYSTIEHSSFTRWLRDHGYDGAWVREYRERPSNLLVFDRSKVRILAKAPSWHSPDRSPFPDLQRGMAEVEGMSVERLPNVGRPRV